MHPILIAASPEDCPPPAGNPGWQAHLALEFRAGATRTELSRRKHIGPLLVQRAFYPETGGNSSGTHPAQATRSPSHVYIIHPPGGVASGDEITLDVQVRAAAHALLTTPAATKFYRRGPKGAARVRQYLRAEGGVIEWLPQESIFYPQAEVELRSIIHLAGAARFIGWEMAAFGLTASARPFEAGDLRLGFELWVDGKPLLLERLRITGDMLGARWGLRGHVALGTALAWPAGKAELDLAHATIERTRGDCAELLLTCTLIDGVLVCRATARRTDRLKQAFVNWWQALRPALLGREAVIPRIWST